MTQVDLCRSVPPPIAQFVLVDDFSRKIFVYFFFKRTDGGFKYFKYFKAEVENQTNKKIKRVRSDNDGEFKNN